MFCKNCGVQLAADAKFCGKCGTPSNGAGAPIRATIPTAPVPPRCVLPPPDNSTQTMIIAAVVLILVCGGGWYWWQGRVMSPPKTKSPSVVVPASLSAASAQKETKPKTSHSENQRMQPEQHSQPNIPRPSEQQNRRDNAMENANVLNQDMSTPAQVLHTFHQNITNKNYRQAYNCLSDDFQNSVSYEGWAPGFRTTVSSTVSNVKVTSQTENQAVLSYTLKAVDNPGGIQYFRGTAVFIKTAEGWKIDDIINKTYK